jgi:hypothetical protein
VKSNATLSRPDAHGHGRAGHSSFVVMKELDPLRDSPRGRLCVRIMQGDRGRRLDIREFVPDAGARGFFTKRGVSLSSEEAGALFEQCDAILRRLNDERGGRAG